MIGPYIILGRLKVNVDQFGQALLIISHSSELVCDFRAFS